MVETDPEIPLHKMMPNAPIVQIIADNDKLKSVTKNLLRSDSDYVIMAEAREGGCTGYRDKNRIQRYSQNEDNLPLTESHGLPL